MDVLKEYLVGLGFKVDVVAFNQAIDAMNKVKTLVEKFAGTATAQFAAAGTAVLAFFAAVNLAIAKFMESLAQADLRNEMFARRMWTTKENAVALNTALEAMGATIDDLYLSPELAQNFFKLRQQALSMFPPGEYQNQMKFIRSIMFEFQRLKLEATYAMQWIGYYLFKYLEKPLQSLKLSLKDLNDMISKRMPEWTKVIAQVLSWFARMGIAAVKAGETIIDLFKRIPKELVVAGGAFAGFFTLLRMGPLGWIIAGITALLLLLDDFYTYQQGGESQFESVWKWMDDMQKSDIIQKLKSDFSDFLESVATLASNLWVTFGQLTESVGKLLDKLAQLAGFKDFKDLMESSILWVLNRLDQVLQSITSLVKMLTDMLNGDFKKAMGDLGDSLNHLLNNSDEKSWTQRWDEFKGDAKEWARIQGEFFYDPAQYWEDTKKSISESWKGIWSNQSMNSSPAYAAPQARNVSTKQVISPTINVYGSGDSYATAQQVSRNMDGLITRNTQGVII